MVKFREKATGLIVIPSEKNLAEFRKFPEYYQEIKDEKPAEKTAKTGEKRPKKAPHKRKK